MGLYRNWPAICKLENSHLRLCAALATDSETLDILRKGAPHLFSDTEIAPKVPISAVREHASHHGDGFSRRTNPADFPVTTGTCEALGIPVQSFWDPSDDLLTDTELPLSEELRATVPSKPGTSFIWEGNEYVVLEIGPGGWEDRKEILWIYLAPAACLDLEK